MSVAFSSKEEDVISRKIDVLPDNALHQEKDLDEFYEIKRCSQWISDNKFCKLALQFPDCLLQDSAEVSRLLEQSSGCQVYISGDTSYGSCCVDEITAEHVNCDAIIHYGRACLSPTNRLPVLYVFSKLPLNLENTVSEFRRVFSDKESLVIVFYEVFYSYIIDDFRRFLEKDYRNVIFSQLQLSTQHLDNEDVSNDNCVEINKCSRTFKIDKEKPLILYKMFYIGCENQTLTNLMLTFNANEFYSLDPMTGYNCHRQTLDVNRYLRKRYYYIEKAKDANIIGILVGTLGVSKYLDVISHLKKIIKESGKKAYTLVVGKLNSAKLANFSEIELFVCVACPECSLIDSHEFYQPIITPFEMETALNNARQWTGDYITDFKEILPGASHHIPFEKSGEDMQGDVSLVTGKIRIVGHDSTTEEPSGYEIIPRNTMTVANILADGSSKALLDRSWKGLDPKLGETPVAEVVQGRRGIAAEYEDENENMQI